MPRPSRRALVGVDVAPLVGRGAPVRGVGFRRAVGLRAVRRERVGVGRAIIQPAGGGVLVLFFHIFYVS